MKYTPNYGLKKPEQDDFYNVEDFNENADIIDEKLKEIEDGIENAEHLRIEVGVSPPENPNSKAFWLEDLGESIDFVSGSALLIGNASTDGSDDVWFDENI